VNTNELTLRIRGTRVGLRNSATRIPFRYGKACLTRCPQLVVEAIIAAGGQTHAGFSGDCLPPGWFDKTPGKDFRAQIDDMLAVLQWSREVYGEEFRNATSFFPAWHRAHDRIQSRCRELGFTKLLAAFGSSLLERAVVDAMCRAARTSFAAAVRANLFGIDAGAVHLGLARLQPRDWLPNEPLPSIFVRHTIGLGDPLTGADVPEQQQLDDGFPQTLEEYVKQCGLRYFKVKVSHDTARDMDRLRQIAAIVQGVRGDDYGLTIDGNEQYPTVSDFAELVAAMQSEPALATLWKNVLAIEQPLERNVALDPARTAGIHELSQSKPVIIDESDGGLEDYAQAIERGYRGVSSKNCKGAIKSILNAGLTWLANGRGTRREFLMTGEDLCSVGVIPVQADLCLAATLGLTHVERNGHHYHPGLSYLPAAQQQAALAAHGDFYSISARGVVAPRLVNGRFEIASLQCTGFGFDVAPDFATMQSLDDWNYASLGLL